ncbi:MAG: DinB family protein [Phycisphaerae bacterium]|nr:DinB family protein [Phycisphaerae bacterium]MDW8262123.1 DinB family protein [Phycisphaerales bacterium]
MTSDPLTILLKHHHWATGVVLDLCQPLSHQQFHQRFDIGPGSLHDTIDHIIGCVEFWTARVKGQRTQSTPAEQTIPELRNRLDASTAAIEALIGELQVADMMDHERTDSLSTPDGRIEATYTCAAAIVHCLVHGTHHRAQALNMLRRLGVQPLPELDVIDWQIKTENPR